MNLTPREKDKLLVAMAAMVARRRLERGVKLNHPEAIALITDHVVEGARDAARHLDGVRALLAEQSGIAATCLGVVLVLRALASDPAPLRRDLARVWRHLRVEAGGLPAVLPRLWHI